MAEWLTVRQLAQYLQVSESKVYAMARGNQLPSSRVGSQWRFDKAEVDRWLKEHTWASGKRTG